MPDPVESVRLYLNAQAKGTQIELAAVASVIAEDVSARGLRGPIEGKGAVIESLGDPRVVDIFRQASWSEPQRDSDVVRVSASFPPGGILRGVDLTFGFAADGRIAHVEQQVTLEPPPPPVEICLAHEIKEAVNGALMNGTPVIVAYVDEEGEPHLSFRGSTQAYSDDQLAIWIRNPQGGLLKAISSNPKVSLLYNDSKTRTTLQFAGRAQAQTAEDVCVQVYGNSPEIERNADPHQMGVPILIDLDSVEGMSQGTRVSMRRGAGQS